MATPCGHCRRLAAEPARIDVPEHLRRMLSDGPPGSFMSTGQHLAVFVCLDCSTQWQWATVRGWTELSQKNAAAPGGSWLARLGILSRSSRTARA